MHAARNWRGLVALEETPGAAAAQFRETRPDTAILVFRMLGLSYKSLGQFATGIQLHEQERAIAEQVGDREGCVMACDNLGMCHDALGHFEKAIGLYGQAQAMEEEARDGRSAERCINLGISYRNMSDHKTAIKLLEEARVIAEDQNVQAKACSNLGICHFSLGSAQFTI